MPYVDPEARQRIDSQMTFPRPQTAGELNYMVTRLVKNFLDGPISYKDINEAVGVMECAKLELYRRVAAPYENIKMQENGDVYD